MQLSQIQRRGPLASALAVLLLAPAPGPGQDRHSPDLTPSDFASLANGQRPLWSVPCRKTNSNPAIAAGKVVLLERTSRQQERVRCFRLNDGLPLWERSYPATLPSFFDDEFGLGPHAAPVVHGQTVFSVGVTGILLAIDLDTGRTRWQRDLWKDFPSATPLERGFAATPLIEANRLILPVGGRGSGLVALDLATGRTLWAATNFAAAYTTPVAGELNGQRQVVALMQDALISVDPSNGTLLWQVPFTTPNSVHVASPIIVDQQRVLAGSSGGTRLFTVARTASGAWTATQLWQNPRCAPQIGNYIRIADQVVAPASGGSSVLTVCLNLKDGSVAWKERFGGRGTLVRLKRKGFLALNDNGDLDVRTHAPSGSQQVLSLPGFTPSPQWNAPVFAEDLMVLQSGDRLQAWRLASRNDKP